MKPVEQTHMKPPFGNCFSACLASIFEVELADVPNFVNNDPPGRWAVDLRDWLSARNLTVEFFELTPGVRPWTRSWVIASVDSPRGDWQHAVVFEGAAFRHDPWPIVDGKWTGGAINDFALIHAIDPSKSATIPQTGAYAADHDPAIQGSTRMSKPILCLDFDGVLHAYTSGWQGIDVIPDGPVPGAAAFIVEALKLFEVVIYSSRSKEESGREAMRVAIADWLEADGFKGRLVDHTTFAHEKPAAFLTIDDRALTFDGTFPNPAALLSFQPWNKHEASR